MRGMLARKTVETMREEEMEFLGMKRKKKTPEEMLNDPIKKLRQSMSDRLTQTFFVHKIRNRYVSSYSGLSLM